ncbi:DUF2771 family protein [Prauserella halophila]|uniref:DUF2771 family protein n=1 Tax=Prauserella halophila TaxID=185641 RepID=A0ABP4GSU1_9PSEU|nr:Protein of unknown function (DUF2771) [Prauserella halophila]
MLAGAALFVTGCSAAPEPEVTFYADGDTTVAAPLIYCNELVDDCGDEGTPVDLDVRPGMPVQVSVPADVAETPWVIIIQYLNAETGEESVEQQTFTDLSQHAYTVTPPTEQDAVAVVEVQQIGAAYGVDAQGNPIVDENGQPQLVTRGLWSLQNSGT